MKLTEGASARTQTVQEMKGTRRPVGISWGKFLSFSLYTIGLLLGIVGGALMMDSSSTLPRHAPRLYVRQAAPETVAVNGADLWDDDTTTTAPSFDFSLAGTGTGGIGVSPLFEGYYASHHGTLNLGAPVTVAFPTDQGWMQFFGSDALLLPADQPVQSFDRDDALRTLAANGLQDPASGIIRLPLIEALLSAGSQVPLEDNGSSFTYVDLRRATDPERMLQVATAGVPRSSSLSLEGQTTFIKTGTRSNKDVGHLIPLPFWSYINRADVAPDGWEGDFGLPLTEALTISFPEQGSAHHLMVQAFARDAVVLDTSVLDASGQPVVSRLNTSLAYLRTIGAPAVAIQPGQGVWAPGETTLLGAPGTDQVVAHVGLHFPLSLLGDAAWNAGMLWYHVQWGVAKRPGSGWVQASLITFTSPGKVAGWASFDALSPALAAYLGSMGGNVDAVVYDVTRQRYYTYNASVQFITGSSMKVPIMLTFLDMIEREGREPDANEMNLLTTMIENSNNDSASALYYGEIGGAAGVAGYLQRIGITGLDPDPDAWGYSLITPLAMVNLLTLLYEGKILSPSHRSLAFSLMEQVETDQQVGVGNTAPAGAVVAMKDGWLPGPDGLWAMNSSGIVMVEGETYIISVYTQEQNSLEDGQVLAQQVCGAVAFLLA